MYKKSKWVLCLTIAATGFFACKKNNNNTVINEIPVVYTAGNILYKPFSTKDGFFFTNFSLASGNDAYVFSMDVNDAGDIYTAGREEKYDISTSTTSAYARLWKNGVVQNVSIGSSSSSGINDVVVKGSDIYLAGSISGKAVYWKNGGATNLTDGSRLAIATSIFVSQSDVFVAGFEGNNVGRSVAKIWKNGVLYSLLSDGTYTTQANSVYVNGSDIYACGVEHNGGSVRPVFWKNGVKNYLSNGYGQADEILVVNNDIYVAGSEKESTRTVAKYWKNGVATVLGKGYSSAATSIAVKNNDVYVAGYEQTLNTSQWVAKYWKNGNPVILTDGSQSAFLYEIVVK